MKKHFFRTLLVLVFCVTLCLGLKTAAYAESGTWGNLSWNLDDGGTLTISGEGAMDDFPMDSTSAWLAYRDSIKSVEITSGVTSIGDYSFLNCSSLTSVSIPDSVISISDKAFGGVNLMNIKVAPTNPYYCDLDGVLYNKSATEIICYPGARAGEYVIPSTVASIVDRAFAFSGNLTSVSIPDSVTSIGVGAFFGCSSLTSVSIPDSVTSIGDMAFSDCSSLTSVTIPDSVTSIGSWVFHGCTGLTSAGPIGSGCDYQFGWTDSIPIHAFDGCTGLTSVTIPDSMTSIDGEAFFGCSGLTSVSIPDSVTSIGDMAFSFCNSLTSVSIPDSVTSIGDSAFFYCSSLESITIPDSVTSIGGAAFGGCSSLTSVSIPDGVTSIGETTFRGCSSLTSVTIPDSVTSIGSGAFFGCSSLTSVSIPASVTSIDNEAFIWCSSLSSVFIPASVTNIGFAPFAYCTGLNAIVVDGNNPAYFDTDGVLYDRNGVLCQYPAAKNEEFLFPDTVTYIGNSAFSGCSGLKSVSIPNRVTYIDDWTFDNCSGLTGVFIPDSVTSIGIGAFDRCSSLNDVYYSGTLEQWQAVEIGSYNDPLTGAVIHYGFKPDFILPAGLTEIGEEAFAGGAFTYVKLSDNTGMIGPFAFAECPNLAYISIPNAEAVIADNAFGSKQKLTILGKPGSSAEAYAAAHDFSFIPAA